MGCRYTEKWLYLYREGELTPGQKAKLESHMRQCRRCMAFRKDLDVTEKGVRELRERSPSLKDPGSFTVQVMEAVTGVSATSHPVRRVQGEGRGAFRPLIRFALAGAVLLILSLFGVQQFWIFSKITRLEQKLAYLSIDTQPEARPLAAEEMFGRIGRGALFYDVLQSTRIMRAAGDNVVIQKSDLDRFLFSYRLLQEDHLKLLNAIRKMSPDLVNIRWEDGFSWDELTTLSSHQADIIRIIHTL